MEIISLKQKATQGILWSSIESFASQFISLIVGIILARMLTPKEFGLIGMVTIFIAVSQSFLESGFSNALIRKKDCTQTDYSTVFFFNLAAGVIFFIVLFISAPAISNFFKEPELKTIVQVLALVLIIDSLTIIQRTILIRRVDFKLQTRISVISSTGSGLFAIILAWKGFGVWSLVGLTLAKESLNSFLLWLWNQWRPALVFSMSSFRELFSFGSKLLVSGLLDTIYRNIYFFIIGKYFSVQELGYFTRAYQFNTASSQSITGIMSRVTFPILAQMQDNPVMLKEGYRKMIKSIMLITFVIMLGMAAIAEPMIISLIGEKWRPSIIYLQMLCFVGMLYPLHALNLNMLNVLGRSDLFLKLEIIKKILAVPTIVLGVLFGMKIMIAGMILNSFIAYYLNSYWSGRFIGYSLLEQIKDILPSFLLAAGMSAIVFIEGLLISLPPLPLLAIQLMTGALFITGICEAIHYKDYVYIKEILKDKFLKKNNL
jgi:teichuronic acid exporter